MLIFIAFACGAMLGFMIAAACCAAGKRDDDALDEHAEALGIGAGDTHSGGAPK